LHFFVFFFQAEDGIRDFHVTGVQTCALPIFRGGRVLVRGGARGGQAARDDGGRGVGELGTGLPPHLRSHRRAVDVQRQGARPVRPGLQLARDGRDGRVLASRERQQGGVRAAGLDDAGEPRACGGERSE